MKNLYLITSICIITSFNLLFAQMGTTTLLSEKVDDGYIHFSLIFNNQSFLIDHCGRLINSWEEGGNNGLSTMILPDGNLLKAESILHPKIQQPSQGGVLQIRNWEDEAIWTFQANGENYIQHHDFTYLPNGNIMYIGWELIDIEEQIELGRDTNELVFPYLWGEFIHEIKPVGAESAELVWEWHLKDHFVQDLYPDKGNYQTISETPRKVNINFFDGDPFSNEDQFHINALDYDPLEDYILLSVRANGELWIIDHSTSSEEASTSEGGNYGYGGDLLYRIGNPRTYERGDSTDQFLFGPHGANFIDEGLPNAGDLIVFNNGTQRPGYEYSTVEIIKPLKSLDDFVLENGSFQIEAHDTIYGQDSSMVSLFVSNAVQTNNGNILIANGEQSQLLETSIEGEKLWEYNIPLLNGFPVSQSSLANNGFVFKAYFYPSNYPGFNDKDLSPSDPIELNIEELLCETVDISEESPFKDLKYQIIGNKLEIKNTNQFLLNSISIFNLQGQLVEEFLPNNSKTYILKDSVPNTFVLVISYNESGISSFIINRSN